MNYAGGNWRNDNAESFSNNGNIDCVTLFEHGGYSGKWIEFRRPGLGGTYRDPNLHNGGGQAGFTGENWANRVSSADTWRC